MRRGRCAGLTPFALAVACAAPIPIQKPRPIPRLLQQTSNIPDMVCRDRPAQSSPVGNRSKFDIVRAGNIPVPDRSGRDSRVGGGQALDSVGGRHRKIEPTPGQSCSEGLPLRALPTQTVSSRQPCWELSLHLNQRLTALANCVPTRSAVAARRSEVLISSVGCQNESISPPHLISALEL